MKKTGLQPATREAMDLLLKGSIAFARIEEAGLRIDVPYLTKAIENTKLSIAEKEKSMRSSPEWRAWAKQYGDEMNTQSRIQLGHVIFGIMGNKRNPFMGKSNDIAAFEHLGLPFLKDYQDIARLKKALSTYLYGIQREMVNGYVHPFQSLAGGQMSGEGSGGAESYRSSSSKPNFHNIPVRNQDIAKLIRTAVIPRKDHVFLEADFGTQEVRMSYCYHKDPKLKYDVLNGDMHRDRAKELFILTDEEMGPNNTQPGKMLRYCSKNGFVFAQFYGDYYAGVAPKLWDMISIFGLKTTAGVSIFEHLKSKGISQLGECDPTLEPIKGTFEHHVKEVERIMWEDNYGVYNQWKKDWWELYQRQGGINTLTGFCMEGVFRRNQVLCDPIQGSAFHCELWSCIEVQKQFIRYKMKSKIVDQVHDSLLVDAHKSELRDVRDMMEETMTIKVSKHWPWISIPLAVEFEICENNWYDKKPLEV